MSATPTTAKQPKAKKDKEKTASQVHQNERLKTVVRRLPPNLPEEIFWQSVQPWVTEETTIWKTYYKGKLRKKLNKENIPSRAYIAFKDPEQLALFSREYDGHTFRDKSGVESQAVVEYAPFPKIPSEKKKVDNRSGTIEKDEDFISFMESLKTPSTTGPVSLEALIASTRPASPPKTTPLLEALKAEKSANKDKEAILRNHAHYNQIMVPSSRKEEKKKASGPPASSRPVETPASTASNVQPKKSGKKGQPPPAASQPAPPPNPKAAPGSQKGAPNTTASQQAGGKPPKAPRPPRGAQQPKGAASVVPGPVPTTPVSVLPNPNANPAQPPSSSAPTPAAANPPAPGGRRARPIIGLASRQFEAALSGVSGLAGSASRKREKEKEKEAAGTKGAPGASATTAGKDGPDGPSSTLSVPATTYARIDSSDTEKMEPLPPPSPKRERHRRHGRGGGAGAGAGGTSSTEAPPANANTVKVSSILQRAPDAPSPIGIQKDPSGPSNPSTGAAATAPSPAIASGNPSVGNHRGGGGGGGRRGRGGGRGRGGAAGGPSNPPRAGG